YLLQAIPTLGSVTNIKIELVMPRSGSQAPATCTKDYGVLNLPPGAKVLIGCRVPIPAADPLSTGLESWTMTVTPTYAAGVRTSYIHDQAIIAERAENFYGNGWDLDAPPRLMHALPGGAGKSNVLLFTGSGLRPREFQCDHDTSGNCTSYTSPPDDFGTLSY